MQCGGKPKPGAERCNDTGENPAWGLAYSLNYKH